MRRIGLRQRSLTRKGSLSVLKIPKYLVADEELCGRCKFGKYQSNGGWQSRRMGHSEFESYREVALE